jgi:histidine ammonia-lyase
VIVLDRHDALDLDTYRRVVAGGEAISIAPELLRHVEERRAAMLLALDAGASAYGVTTGLGYLAGREIPPADRLALQRRILLGRAVAVGPPAPREVVRGTMLLRLTGFLEGSAGVTAALCTFIADRLNEGWEPYVPVRPHGAAGEITQLAHLFQTFVGEGFVLVDGTRVAAADALTVPPYEPQLKEGIALVNGAPFAPALAAPLVWRSRALLDHAITSAALASAVVGASGRPFSTRVGRLKGDPGQAAVHERLVALLPDTADRPQPPVSFRVAPQVLGAVADVVAAAERQLERELRAVTDSPVFLPEEDDEPEGFYPTGNYQSQALSFTLDALAVAFAQLANLSEKRLHRVLDARFSGLPEQLALDPGRQTGMSVLHKGVVALCAENRLLAAPASVAAFDTSAGQEDFQAFTPLAAEKLDRLLDNVELALAYELVALAQARSLRDDALPPALAEAVAWLDLPQVAEDRSLAPDVERVRELIRARSSFR